MLDPLRKIIEPVQYNLQMDKKAYHREWYKKNRENQLAKAKTNRQANPEVRSSWLKLNGSKPKVRFDKAKGNTKARGKAWELTLEQYCELIAKTCDYCEADMSDDRGSGLDRLDNSKGYSLGNVVPCCGVCNTGRNDNFSPEEWKVGIQAIIAFRSQKT